MTRTTFLQDTNGLAFHTLPLALGVSSKMGLVMNSIAIPRKAKQAIGGIVKLQNDAGEERYVQQPCLHEANLNSRILTVVGAQKWRCNEDPK